jgi:hypothetical protein
MIPYTSNIDVVITPLFYYVLDIVHQNTAVLTDLALTRPVYIANMSVSDTMAHISYGKQLYHSGFGLVYKLGLIAQSPTLQSVLNLHLMQSRITHLKGINLAEAVFNPSSHSRAIALECASALAPIPLPL